jgi:hypothetical protein
MGSRRNYTGDGTFNVDKLNGGTDAEGTGLPYYVDGSDALANKKQIVTFYHLNSDHSVAFKAFIMAFTETYNSDWSAETVYGRNDPIYMFKNTTRKISLTFKVPAATIGESYENLGRVQKLLQFLYPNYSGLTPRTYNAATESWEQAPGTAHANTISASPLVRLQVMNLVRRRGGESGGSGGGGLEDEFTPRQYVPGRDDKIGMDATFRSLRSKAHLSPMPSLPEDGLLGVIQNVNINHSLDSDDGVFEQPGGSILPKLIEVTVDFSAIHESHLGWFDDGTFGSEAFPYGAVPGGSAQNEDYYKPFDYTAAEASDTGASSGETNADEQLPTGNANADAAQGDDQEEPTRQLSPQEYANAIAAGNDAREAFGNVVQGWGIELSEGQEDLVFADFENRQRQVAAGELTTAEADALLAERVKGFLNE